MEDLALKVRVVHDVEVDEPDRPDARGREVDRERGSEPSGADREHARGLQLLLPVDADLRHDQVSRVAADLLVREAPLTLAGPPRDRRHDREHVVRGEARLVLFEVAHVLVVLVQVDERPDLSGVVVQVLAKRGVPLHEGSERRSHCRALDVHGRGAVRVGAERRGQEDPGHSVTTSFPRESLLSRTLRSLREASRP